MGVTLQMIRASIIARAGLIMYTRRLERVGRVNSLVNSLIASANGWGTPANPTLLGPLRS